MATWIAPTPERSVSPGAGSTFSVVVPTYQMADLVVDAIASALAQTRPPHEVIVCDDGSTDDTQDALRRFGDRIRVIRKENAGVASAKNAAARVATGDFVAVLDADDLYLPGRLEALNELATARPDLDLLNSDVYLEADGAIVSRLTDRNPFPVADQRGAILERNFMWSGAAIRRERLAAVGGFDESVDFADDWDCWRRLIFSGSRAGLVNEPLAIYRIHDRAMNADRRRRHAGVVQALERAADSDALAPRERVIVNASLRENRRELGLADAEQKLRAGSAGVRRALLRIGFGCGFSAMTRAKAALAALAPGMARRRLSALEHRGRESRLARRMPERTDGQASSEGPE